MHATLIWGISMVVNYSCFLVIPNDKPSLVSIHKVGVGGWRICGNLRDKIDSPPMLMTPLQNLEPLKNVVTTHPRSTVLHESCFTKAYSRQVYHQIVGDTCIINQ